jgi:hypothetical protein
MLLAAFLSRVPMGILALATVLFLHQEHRSYAIAGLVGGRIGFGLAISAVLQARVALTVAVASSALRSEPRSSPPSSRWPRCSASQRWTQVGMRSPSRRWGDRAFRPPSWP